VSQPDQVSRPAGGGKAADRTVTSTQDADLPTVTTAGQASAPAGGGKPARPAPKPGAKPQTASGSAASSSSSPTQAIPTTPPSAPEPPRDRSDRFGQWHRAGLRRARYGPAGVPAEPSGTGEAVGRAGLWPSGADRPPSCAVVGTAGTAGTAVSVRRPGGPRDPTVADATRACPGDPAGGDPGPGPACPGPACPCSACPDATGARPSDRTAGGAASDLS
jgi:hypothetical protein